ncbi:hypothetical protein SISSUDRAFT_995419, partial [Sistotremastrum suecicum HHB10207 ss-3]
VVDIMHEFEIGEWLGILRHLIEILRSYRPHMVCEMDRRYVVSPCAYVFGDYTIRKFRTDVFEPKRLAGRDYEDLLQVALPVFEGLFPTRRDDAVANLLFALLVDWHSLAKLRLHTTTTLDYLSAAPLILGEAFRQFADMTCPALQHQFMLRRPRLHFFGSYVENIKRYGTFDSYTSGIVSV